MTKEEINITLDGFYKLEKNWNSYGGERISGKAIERCRSCVNDKDTAFGAGEVYVFPCQDGGVVLEIYGKGYEPVMEFHPDGNISFFVCDSEITDSQYISVPGGI